MRIVILEDNADRRAAMFDCLRQVRPEAKVEFFETAANAIGFFERRLAEVSLISLDHDLEVIPSNDGTCSGPGTGRDVADDLAQRTPVCPVVIHSTNAPAVVGMKSVLRSAGWKVSRVVPYGDLEWIAEVWMPKVRKVLLSS